MPRPAVPDRVVQRLLRDPEQAQGEIGRKRRRDVMMRERDIDTRLRQFARQALERRAEADQTPLRGLQTMREIVHALADELRAMEHLSEHITTVAASHQLQVDLQPREL